MEGSMGNAFRMPLGDGDEIVVEVDGVSGQTTISVWQDFSVSRATLTGRQAGSLGKALVSERFDKELWEREYHAIAPDPTPCPCRQTEPEDEPEKAVNSVLAANLYDPALYFRAKYNGVPDFLNTTRIVGPYSEGA